MDIHPVYWKIARRLIVTRNTLRVMPTVSDDEREMLAVALKHIHKAQEALSKARLYRFYEED